MNIEQLLHTKAGKQLVNDFNVEQDKQRSDLFVQMDRIKEQRNSELQTLNLALTKAQTNCDKAQQALELAQATKHTATVKVTQAKAGYSSQVVRIQKEMMLSAPPEIDTFCKSLQEEATKLRSTAIKSPPDNVRYGPLSAGLYVVEVATLSFL